MKFLLTNDDGIDAPGLAAMAKALSALGRVYVAAPDHNCSLNGHHLTMYERIPVKKQDFSGAESAWAIGGTPADCVHLALKTLLPQKVDLVVSGINRGSNLATDCLYSGTVAAAMDGLLLGFSSLAVSLDTSNRNADYSAAAWYGIHMARYLLGRKKPTLLNVNVPELPLELIHGVRVAAIDRVQSYPGDCYVRDAESTEECAYRFKSCPGSYSDVSKDVRAVLEGWVAVTPLTCFWSSDADIPEISADLDSENETVGD